MKKTLLVLALSLNFSLALSTSAHAFDYGRTSSSAAANTVSDSKFVLSKQTKPDTRWIMIKISKDGKDEQVLSKVENSRLSMNLYLRSGAGTYTIAIFESSAVDQFQGGYYGTQTLSVVNKDTRDLSFLLPSTLVQSDNEEIIALAKSLTEGSKSDLEALKKIHVYVANTIKYDFDSYYDGTYAEKPYDAVGVLKRLKGVCSGYSNLYAALARAVGIRTKIIEGIGYLGNGQTGDHAWNEVFIDNEWKSVDVTWDSTTKRMFKYFLIAEEVFAKDHQKQKENLAN